MTYHKENEKIFSLEAVPEGTLRLMNEKLYYSSEVFYGLYGYRKTRWEPLKLDKILNEFLKNKEK